MTNDLEVLTAARTKIANGWIKWHLNNPKTNEYCAMGAILFAFETPTLQESCWSIGNNHRYPSVVDRIWNELPDKWKWKNKTHYLNKWDDIATYNNVETTTHEDVLALFDRAIAKLQPQLPAVLTDLLNVKETV